MIVKEREANWAEEFDGAVTICDRQGKIVYMNQHSVQQFHKYGGKQLLGTNLLDCHPEPSKSKLRQMLKSPVNNIYTIESSGVKKIIYQTPWKVHGKILGIIEISFQIDRELPHFIR